MLSSQSPIACSTSLCDWVTSSQYTTSSRVNGKQIRVRVTEVTCCNQSSLVRVRLDYNDRQHMSFREMETKSKHHPQ